MKQITIYEFLKRNKEMLTGFICAGYDKFGWWLFKEEPEAFDYWCLDLEKCCHLNTIANIAPFDGDWKDSLIKVEHKEEE